MAKLQENVQEKMKNVITHIRKYPLSTLCIVIVWILSLVPFFPETPLDGIEFIDKWTHLVMYGGTCLVIWFEYRRQHRHADYEKLLFWGWGAPIAMSGVLELLQAYATTTRNGDWMDFIANFTGATLGALIGFILIKCFPRR